MVPAEANVVLKAHGFHCHPEWSPVGAGIAGDCLEESRL
jgi:hypothetical protein